MARSTKKIPIIDMADSSGQLPEKIVRSCEEFGCFRLVNHRIPIPVMRDMRAVARALLDLPLEVKMRNSNLQEPAKGYTPPNLASPFFDSLSLYDMGSDGSVDEFCAQMNASPQQRAIIHNYTSSLLQLVQFMGTKLLEGLGLSGCPFQRGICQLKMNNYNYTPETVGKTGAVLHSDAGLFTILHDDDDVNGLEAVDNSTGELISVDPLPGSLVVNVGDVGKHQVKCYKPARRITIALFVLPPKDGKVEVLSELVDCQNPPLYVPFDFEEYRKLRISTSSATGEALGYFRTNQESLK
ncbi:2-oxoglutarate (2OG) and Fe(II)-dependent oxygenase superfamily protein [Striga asiatica]|uniref:2-oxoglutarate (2OG) and Fe(II)-dependent oxygenase superfamily protein n=1 Tax=Striga asiatica TaxID=4170 RepID=A0A5A7PLY2_STRAF|nr:2-oxoglutarate (2OG) and Fe(II)-dependent oxygenase superfamily protein [Striga asiatica]